MALLSCQVALSGHWYSLPLLPIILHMRIIRHVGRGQTSYFGCQSLGPRGGVLGEGQPATATPARGLEECCKVPQRGPGWSSGCKNVFLHSRGTTWPLSEHVGGQVQGGHDPFGPPIKSACVVWAAWGIMFSTCMSACACLLAEASSIWLAVAYIIHKNCAKFLQDRGLLKWVKCRLRHSEGISRMQCVKFTACLRCSFRL